MKVFINPGHALGGHPDPGAVNHELGIRECDIAMTVGSLAANFLSLAGHEVSLLQSDNLMGESEGPNVTARANAWGADVFVSIHCNAADGTARGTETFCWEYGGAGERLAASLQQAVWGCLSAVDGEFPDRGVKVRKDLCVLRVTNMPAALSELAFIDQPQDAALLMQYGAELGKAIAEGVMGAY
ncbi:MAG: N-acetylmuramoyl-L-alanine amidase [Selenomonadaceae bacterium]|nr:N-acetylmuramoyl-L-alanine amidase [Selenomonadaceae bacterium]